MNAESLCVPRDQPEKEREGEEERERKSQHGGGQPYAKTPFLMTFATGGIPHAGSGQATLLLAFPTLL